MIGSISYQSGVGLFTAQQVIVAIRIVVAVFAVPMLCICCAFALVAVAMLLCFSFANSVTIRIAVATDLLYIRSAFAVQSHELYWKYIATTLR